MILENKLECLSLGSPFSLRGSPYANPGTLLPL
jgi:hypothetical protein